MEQDKCKSIVVDSEHRYSAPETNVIFVNTKGVLCQSPGDGPMREYDFGGGGFGNDY